jgi:hypothetical protein
MKHQRQDARSVSTPPINGPRTDPTDQEPRTSGKYLGRCLRGTMSQKMTWVSVIIPPPPTPWMHRPVSIKVKSFATVQSTVPTVKSRSERMRSC